MILTVCPNPCIDNTIYINNFAAGKLHRPEKKVVSLSGKALNVAIVAARMGYDSYATGFMFDDGAKKFYERLNGEGVPYIFTMCEGAVRVNTKIISLPEKTLTEINERGTPVGYDKQFELIESVRNLSKNAEYIVFSGSLPPDLSEDFYFTAGKAVDKNCRIVVDAEGEKLMSALKLNPVLVKPNLYELGLASGVKITDTKSALGAADILIKKGAKNVLVSMGGGGAFIYNGKEAYIAKAPRVDVKSTVGAGDSMLAVACIALSSGYCLEALIKSAVAGGTAAVMGEGTELLNKTDYDHIFPLVETEKLR